MKRKEMMFENERKENVLDNKTGIKHEAHYTILFSGGDTELKKWKRNDSYDSREKI